MSDETETTALTVVSTNPAAELSVSQQAAHACKQIVTATAVTIQGRKYVKCEGWQAIAIAHGCVASSRSVERIGEWSEPGAGIKAVGEVRRRDTGVVIAEAEGFVGDDEPLWAKRSESARRAMAQTRAISRACRSAFAHVVVLMQAGLQTTPAEEMENHNHQSEPKDREPNGALITPPMQKRLFAIAKGAGHSNDEIAAFLKGQGIRHSSEITRTAYDALCERLKDPAPLIADDSEDFPEWSHPEPGQAG